MTVAADVRFAVPMLDLVRTTLGIEHARASRQLYVVGAQLPWEVSTEDDVDEEVRQTARDPIVRPPRGAARQVTDPLLALFVDRRTQGRGFVEAVRELVDDVETIADCYGRAAAQDVPDSCDDA